MTIMHRDMEKRKMPEPINVPEFTSVEEFNKWVNGLKDTDIQRWTSADWVNMYRHLDKINQQSPYLRAIDNSDMYDLRGSGIEESLIKLKRNYRLEEDQYNLLVTQGENFGKKIATEDAISLPGTALNNSYRDKYIKQGTLQIDKEFYETTNYPKSETSLANYDEVAPTIEVLPRTQMQEGDMGSASLQKIEMSSESGFEAVRVATHESGHYWGQIARNDQQNLFYNSGRNEIPMDGFSEDFFELQRYDRKYYIHSNVDKEAYSNQAVEISTETRAQATDKSFKKEINWSGSSEITADSFSSWMGEAEDVLYGKDGRIKFIYREKEGIIDNTLNFLDNGNEGIKHSVKKTEDNIVIHEFLDEKNNIVLSAKYTPYNNSEGICEITLPKNEGNFSLVNAVQRSGVRFENGGQSIIINGSNVDWEKVQEGKFKTIEFDNVQSLPENLDLSNCYKVSFKGNCAISQGIKLPENIDFSECKEVIINNGAIPKGADLSYCDRVIFRGECSSIPEGVQLPIDVTYENATISADMNFNRNSVKFRGDIQLQEGAKMPKIAFFDDINLPNKVDWGECKQVIFRGEIKNIPTNLPEMVILDGTTIPAGTDLSQCKNLKLENINDIPENVQLPTQKIEVAENCSPAVRGRIERHNANVNGQKFNNQVDYRQMLSKGKEAVQKQVSRASQLVMQAYKESKEATIKMANEFAQTETGKQIISKLKKTSKYTGVALELAALTYGVAQTIDYAKEGDWVGTALAELSMAAVAIPKVGWAVSLGVDLVALPIYEEEKKQKREYDAKHVIEYNSPQVARNITEEQSKNREVELKGAETGQIVPGDVTYSSVSGTRQNQAFIFNQQIITEEDIAKAAEKYSKECEEAFWTTMDYQIARAENYGIIIPGEAKRREKAFQEAKKNQQINNANEVTHSHDKDTRVITGATVSKDETNTNNRNYRREKSFEEDRKQKAKQVKKTCTSFAKRIEKRKQEGEQRDNTPCTNQFGCSLCGLRYTCKKEKYSNWEKNEKNKINQGRRDVDPIVYQNYKGRGYN